MAHKIYSQIEDTICNTEVTPETWQTALDDLQLIKSYEKVKNSSNFKIIPVFFHIARKSDGTFHWETSDTYLESLIDSLNVAFAPAKLQFVKMGETSFIDDDFVSSYTFFDDLSWYPSGYNVYFTEKNTASQALFPDTIIRDNYAFINTTPSSSNFEDNHKIIVNTLIHETGHSFFLFHTFSGARYYSNPLDPMVNYNVPLSQTDYPYATDIVTGDSTHNIARRELVIRATNQGSGNYFWKTNKDQAGDLVEDTHASCQPGERYNFPDPDDMDCDTFPSPSNPGTCSSGCTYNATSCNYTGNYVDYNGDPLVADSILSNYMSYFLLCRGKFTPGQYTRMLGSYYEYRASQYDTLGFNIHDKVEFEDTDIGLSNVSIRFSFPNKTEYCRATTTQDGSFHGILYDSLTSAYVWKWGSFQQVRQLGYDADQGAYQSSYLFKPTYEDWKENITIFDAIKIKKHVLGIDTLNGYRQLAADVNNSGTITTLDVITVLKLLTRKIEKFTNYDRPRRFLPESIPANYPAEFHANPFLININGTQYTNNAYMDTILQVIPDGENGISGYDGIKLGDVNGSSGISACPGDDIDLFLPPIVKNAGTELNIDILADDFSNIEGFQVSLNIDSTSLELMSISSNILPGFTQTANVGYSKFSPDELIIIWYDDNLTPLTINSNTTLFTIKVKTKTSINGLDDKLELNSLSPTLFVGSSSDCGKDMQLEGVISETPQGLSLAGTDNTLNTEEEQQAVQEEKVVYNLGKLTCYPNPFTEDINVLFRSQAQQKTAQLFIADIHGHKIVRQDIELKKGLNKVSVKNFNFSDGLYILSIQSKEGIFNQKIIRQ